MKKNDVMISKRAAVKEMERIALQVGKDKVRTVARCINAIELLPPIKVDGNTSDGYHTFNELYDHRAKLFSVIVRNYPELCWKSKQHHDGTMYDGMFIVGINTPQGQASYHYDIDPYWDMFDCREMERAPEWDGHTPTEAIDRIAALPALDMHPVVYGQWIINNIVIDNNGRTMPDWPECSNCGRKSDLEYNFCPSCGARMDGGEESERN